LDIAFFELLMKPEGGRLRDLLFEPLDRATADLVRIYISDALKEVPEIRVSSIQTRIDDSGDTPTIVALVCFSIYQTDVTGSVSYVVGGSNG
jgi:phage baseplate assembly protein W